MLFNGSIFENIANGLVGTPWEDASEKAKRERVEEAARLAFAHDFIMDLPSGYDSPVGQKGGLLSGGQKQRVAIARSIISEPKILLLDEATSALDPHAEGVVQNALDRASQNRTTIVIAHKLATIRNADNIVVMSKGVIVEQGRHEQLVAQGGTYANLVKAQDLSSGQTTDNFHAHMQETSGDVSEADASSVTRYPTTTMQQLGEMQKREDYSLAPKAGLLRNVLSLVLSTPELTYWYLLVLVCCVVGGRLLPLTPFSTADVCSCHLSRPSVAFGKCNGHRLLR